MAKSGSSWPFDTLGDGKSAPWIWLHGWGMDRRALGRLAQQFTKSHRHILYDQPGFGEAVKLAGDASTTDYATALLDQPGFQDPTILIGHSFGARVAVRTALAAPQKVKALIIIAGAGPRRPRSMGWKLKSWALKVVGQMAGFVDQVSGTSLKARYRERFGSADYKAAGDLRGTMVKTIIEDLAPLSQEVKCPVLLLYGDMDKEAPPVLGEQYARNMPNAQFHVLPGYDHWDILTRGVYQCEALIRAFLQEHKL